jgi:hypothetical protein
MNKAQALAKLAKLLGKTMRYRVAPGSPNAEERARCRDNAVAGRATLKLLAEKMRLRREEILAANEDYAGMRALHKELTDSTDATYSKSASFPITVGRDTGMFFSVDAEGDNWAEVVEKVAARMAHRNL